MKALNEEAREGKQGRRLAGIVELARENNSTESVQSLQAKLETDSGNSETRYQLAIAESLAGNVQGAMDHLLKLVQSDPDYNDGAPRAKLLALFNVLGDDPLAGQYRRKLFALLH